MSSPSQSALLLMKQLKDLNKRPVEGFSAGLKDDDDPFVWEIMIMGPPDTPYEGGFFQAEMNFPKEYPNMPPTLRFISDIVHPNVYPDGKVCMSILHPPGEDQWVRVGGGALAAAAHGRVDPPLADLDDLVAQRRVARQH